MLAEVVTQAPERRLRSRRLYPGIVSLIVVAVVVITVLALDYSHGSWAARIDRVADPRLIARFGRHLDFVNGFSNLGGGGPIVLVTSALVIVTLGLGRLRGTVLAGAAPVVGAVITEAFSSR